MKMFLAGLFFRSIETSIINIWQRWECSTHVQVKSKSQVPIIKSQASPSRRYTQPSQVKSVVHFKQVKSSPA